MHAVAGCGCGVARSHCCEQLLDITSEQRLMNVSSIVVRVANRGSNARTEAILRILCTGSRGRASESSSGHARAHARLARGPAAPAHPPWIPMLCSRLRSTCYPPAPTKWHRAAERHSTERSAAASGSGVQPLRHQRTVVPSAVVVHFSMCTTTHTPVPFGQSLSVRVLERAHLTTDWRGLSKL